MKSEIPFKKSFTLSLLFLLLSITGHAYQFDVQKNSIKADQGLIAMMDNRSILNDNDPILMPLWERRLMNDLNKVSIEHHFSFEINASNYSPRFRYHRSARRRNAASVFGRALLEVGYGLLEMKYGR